MKKHYVVDLREGQKIEDVFLVASKSLGTTRSGSPFIKMSLADRTGTLNAVKWDSSELEFARLCEGGFCVVRGAVGQYNGDIQLTVESFQEPSVQADPADFVARSDRDPDEMFAELKLVLGGVANPDLRRLLDDLLGDDEFAAAFKQAPAAKTLHHACIGGLLEHTLNVVRNALALAQFYPSVDKDLLTAAAVLHDVGKIEEFEWSTEIRYSDSGHFVGHIVAATAMVREAIDRIPDFDRTTGLALQHAILAHHGEKEYGSPKRPKSVEAVILHVADNVDATIAIMEQAVADSDRKGETGLFTKRHFLLDRPLFKGRISGDSSEDDGPDVAAFGVEQDDDPFAD